MPQQLLSLFRPLEPRLYGPFLTLLDNVLSITLRCPLNLFMLTVLDQLFVLCRGFGLAWEGPGLWACNFSRVFS